MYDGATIRPCCHAVIPAMLLGLTTASLAQTVAPTMPAASAKTAITLQPYTAADLSASAGVPAGWKVTQSGGAEIIMTGPEGEIVFLGTMILAHNGAFQLGQKGPAPAALSMPDSASLAQKLTMIAQQNAAVVGQPDPQVVIASASPFQGAPGLGQCGNFVLNLVGKTAQGQLAPLSATAYFCSSPPDQAGLFKNIFVMAQAPVAIAAQFAPTATAIFASYRIPVRAVPNSLQSTNCFDASIRGIPTFFLPVSCGGPWPDPSPTGPQ
jgi:hypothetical protein